MGQPGYHQQQLEYQTYKSLKILKRVLGQHPVILREIGGSRWLFASYGMRVFKFRHVPHLLNHL